MWKFCETHSTLVIHAEQFMMPHPFLIFSQSDYLIQVFDTKFTSLMVNSADPDQLASSEAHRSGSTLFEKAGHIQVQQDQS